MKETRERGRRGEWVHGWVRTKLQMIVYWSWSWSYHHDGSRPDPLTYYWDVRTNVHNFNRQMAASRRPQKLGHSIRRFLECFVISSILTFESEKKERKNDLDDQYSCHVVIGSLFHFTTVIEMNFPHEI